MYGSPPIKPFKRKTLVYLLWSKKGNQMAIMFSWFLTQKSKKMLIQEGKRLCKSCKKAKIDINTCHVILFWLGLFLWNCYHFLPHSPSILWCGPEIVSANLCCRILRCISFVISTIPSTVSYMGTTSMSFHKYHLEGPATAGGCHSFLHS